MTNPDMTGEDYFNRLQFIRKVFRKSFRKAGFNAEQSWKLSFTAFANQYIAGAISSELTDKEIKKELKEYAKKEFEQYKERLQDGN